MFIKKFVIFFPLFLILNVDAMKNLNLFEGEIPDNFIQIMPRAIEKSINIGDSSCIEKVVKAVFENIDISIIDTAFEAKEAKSCIRETEKERRSRVENKVNAFLADTKNTYEEYLEGGVTYSCKEYVIASLLGHVYFFWTALHNQVDD